MYMYMYMYMYVCVKVSRVSPDVGAHVDINVEISSRYSIPQHEEGRRDSERGESGEGESGREERRERRNECLFYWRT